LSCFVIGGECRLCFPQMKALCLGDIPTYKIDEMMKNLAIINPHSSEEQLNVLKRNQIVPSYLPKYVFLFLLNLVDSEASPIS